MADISIKRSHAVGRDEARRRVAALEHKLRDKLGVELTWLGHVATFKGRGVSGTLTVENDSVSVDVKLGLLVKPLAGKIRDGVERGLNSALAAA